ncbi:uncharacterized protein LOC120215277 isoform X2 [Hibiscus syriacus]|uniref:uncharacterized protein LOC120215277 isoform X2 n=1 Tax=Hibiscus syriacus TaxID=106335 RepID=UPI0019229E0A|nr:uncharacterized protein LOC120215277 isoform X2 [Hibiscus syriacus]
MGTEQPKSVTINVTGFKKFQGVAENPTETIVNNLTSFVQRKGLLPAGVTLGSCTVLETAGDGALPVLYKVLESGTSGIHTKKEHIVWLHLGVDGGAEKFALERQAVNEATFFCPDELGWQPMRQPIVAEDGGTSRKREFATFHCHVLDISYTFSLSETVINILSLLVLEDDLFD